LAVNQPENVDAVMASIPGTGRFLPLTTGLLAAPPDGRPFDARFSVDTASINLLSADEGVRTALRAIRPIVNIDHHVTNERYGAPTQIPPRMHLVIATLATVVPPRQHAPPLTHLLARPAPRQCE